MQLKEKVFFHEFELIVLPSVYKPREDSFILAENLMKQELKNKRFLDLGCGSGIQGIIAAKKNAKVIALDVNQKAVENTRLNAQILGQKISVKQSNLFSALKKLPEKKQKFDFIAFNPPYLPSETIEDNAVDGLKNGSFFIEKFLNELNNYLSAEGKAFLIVSSLNKLEAVKKLAFVLGFKFKIIAVKKLFFEKLFLIELTLKE